jgi:hypothetical protein
MIHSLVNINWVPSDGSHVVVSIVVMDAAKNADFTVIFAIVFENYTVIWMR